MSKTPSSPTLRADAPRVAGLVADVSIDIPPAAAARGTRRSQSRFADALARACDRADALCSGVNAPAWSTTCPWSGGGVHGAAAVARLVTRRTAHAMSATSAWRRRAGSRPKGCRSVRSRRDKRGASELRSGMSAWNVIPAADDVTAKPLVFARLGWHRSGQVRRRLALVLRHGPRAPRERVSDDRRQRPVVLEETTCAQRTRTEQDLAACRRDGLVPDDEVGD